MRILWGFRVPESHGFKTHVPRRFCLAGRLNSALKPSLAGIMTGTGAARQTAIAVTVLFEGHTRTKRGHHWRPNAPRISGTGTFLGDRRLIVCDALVNRDYHAIA